MLASIRRALLILDALLKACEQRGFQLAPGPSITIENHKITLGVSEIIETTREEAGDDDNDLRGEYSFGHSRFKTTRVSTERLMLAVTDGRGYWASGSRSTWRDTVKVRLEDRLGQVLLGLTEIAEMAKQHEEEQERRWEAERNAEARRQEAARQLAERRKQYKQEKTRFTQLVQQAESLRKSQMIRELIEAVRHHGQPNPVVPDGDTIAWIEWATRQADRLDPLRPNSPSILDEKLDEEPPPSPYAPQEYYSSSPPTYWQQRNRWNRHR